MGNLDDSHDYDKGASSVYAICYGGDLGDAPD